MSDDQSPMDHDVTHHFSSDHDKVDRAGEPHAVVFNNGPGVVSVVTIAQTNHVLKPGGFLFGDVPLPITVDFIEGKSTIITIDLAATAPPGTSLN
jgi:hypothetical protein